ncbi:16S rRNA (uracil(1498)-N(3))-methyltransferase [Thermaerobacillus caldiproteolyticus]|uniref:Ribosomal RNA small subunit methyltransferase E n=1 Tax=Thermaerobacillus caldiproteolyticus TaxID=247480 RepID=A0A7W0BX19_9BACL|nr:16S rRNA (uracil(1498)-N(3))-methyltransferase [Anoxybacillus caldiproteolyticus]MBA2873533.1 16S rRNA (uracil1498-N3)-methyltransferase [Anoxybacillus caldiproteolyticus]QPA30122.1 16S rRNA (uracil(1498)-N(3))-methyltransferase [Anoxybacillus caldiproteolyticus]
MQRYFVSDEQIVNREHIVIDGDDYHHIVRVMRMNEGDGLICCSEHSEVALCQIEQITNENVIVRIIQWIEEQTELPIQIYIAQGLPKGDKLELVIQKGTELGAFSFIPFTAARSVVKWDAKKADKKLERWRKIAKEAAEQSHRARIPDIYAPMSIHELIQFAATVDYKLVAYEEEAKKGEHAALANILRQMKQGQSLLALFGPEGGVSEQEMVLLKENGFLPCSLGPRILRTETAPLYLLAAASYEFELM